MVHNVAASRVAAQVNHRNTHDKCWLSERSFVESISSEFRTSISRHWLRTMRRSRNSDGKEKKSQEDYEKS